MMKKNNNEYNFNITETYLLNEKPFNNKGLRYIINQGGSRSGKTYSICQLLFKYALLNKGKKVDIVRSTWPALRDNPMKDFIEIMSRYNLYSDKIHNKTERTLTFPNGSVVHFLVADDYIKISGSKRDVLYCNEANSLDFMIFNNLDIRTRDKVIIDFNPTDSDNWIYELLSNKSEDCILIKTTYKNNGFLPNHQKKVIEDLIKVDRNMYNIYALGERPLISSRIYNHFKVYKELPSKIDDVIYGIDFGFNHPTTLIKVYWSDGVAYCEEIFYETGKTSNDIVNLLNNNNIDKDSYIYADWARPEIIEDMKRAGYNVKEANKNVNAGINNVKMTEIYISDESENMLDEYKKYSWKSKGEKIIDEPVKLFDDCMDALRYAIHTYKDSNNDASSYGFFD